MLETLLPQLRYETHTHTHTHGLRYCVLALHSKTQHTSAYISIRQHTSAYVQHTSAGTACGFRSFCVLAFHLLEKQKTYELLKNKTAEHFKQNWRYCVLTQNLLPVRPYVSIRKHTSAYVNVRQHTSAYASIRQHTSAYVSIRQHTSSIGSRYCVVALKSHYLCTLNVLHEAFRY
jgi:hypothetical protein